MKTALLTRGKWQSIVYLAWPSWSLPMEGRLALCGASHSLRPEPPDILAHMSSCLELTTAQWNKRAEEATASSLFILRTSRGPFKGGSRSSPTNSVFAFARGQRSRSESCFQAPWDTRPTRRSRGQNNACLPPLQVHCYS